MSELLDKHIAEQYERNMRELRNLVQFANRMSVILSGGYDEKPGEMLERVEKLVELERIGNIGNAHQKIADAARELIDVIEGAESGCQ